MRAELTAAGDRSVRHPADEPPVRGAIVHDLFAPAFAQVGARGRRRSSAR